MGEAAEENTTEELEVTAEASEGIETTEESQEPEGFDVVLEDSDSLPKSETVPLSAHINAKRKWKDRTHEAEKSNEALQAENELLRMQIAPKPETQEMPTFENSGYNEDVYRERLQEFSKTANAAEVQKLVDERMAQASQTTRQNERETEFDSAINRHYEAAAKLGVSDFDEAENKMIEIVGKDLAQQLIATSDNSHIMVYFLGKNPDKAAYYAKLVKSNPIKGVMELGKLEAKLKLQPRNKPTSIPDESPEGGSAPANTAGWQRKLDKIRDSGEPGSVRSANLLKSEALKAGITLE